LFIGGYDSSLERRFNLVSSLKTFFSASRAKSSNVREANYFYCLANVSTFYDVIVTSDGIADGDILRAGFVLASEIDEALGKLSNKHGKDAKIAFVTHGF